MPLSSSSFMADRPESGRVVVSDTKDPSPSLRPGEVSRGAGRGPGILAGVRSTSAQTARKTISRLVVGGDAPACVERPLVRPHSNTRGPPAAHRAVTTAPGGADAGREAGPADLRPPRPRAAAASSSARGRSVRRRRRRRHGPGHGAGRRAPSSPGTRRGGPPGAASPASAACRCAGSAVRAWTSSAARPAPAAAEPSGTVAGRTARAVRRRQLGGGHEGDDVDLGVQRRPGRDGEVGAVDRRAVGHPAHRQTAVDARGRVVRVPLETARDVVGERRRRTGRGRRERAHRHTKESVPQRHQRRWPWPTSRVRGRGARRCRHADAGPRRRAPRAASTCARIVATTRWDSSVGTAAAPSPVTSTTRPGRSVAVTT